MPAGIEPLCGPSNAATDEAGQPMPRLPPGWGGLSIGLFTIPAQQTSGAACVTSAMLIIATQGQGRAAGPATTADQPGLQHRLHTDLRLSADSDLQRQRVDDSIRNVSAVN